jgi:hypothetical protein
MRFRRRALLGIILILTFSVVGGRGYGSGQPNQTYDAQTQLINAFVLVQQAEAAGASQEKISQLANNLNLALQYQRNSSRLLAENATASNLYANKSTALLVATTTEALSVANAARGQVSLREDAAYSIAIAAGFVSALLITEFHRVSEFARRLGLRRMRIEE